MPTSLRPAALLALLAAFAACPPARAAEPEKPSLIHWQPWSDAAFEQAKRENKQVLLDLHAVWCHWCHVMDDTTYADPEIAAYINAHFIPVGVDQDARPDISAKYEDYGWPATIVFAGDRTEIVKRSGYIAPPQMLAMLKAIVADPTPGPSAAPTGPVRYSDSMSYTPEQCDKLASLFESAYDKSEGSWGSSGQKFLIWDNLEYTIHRTLAGDKFARQALDQTLNGARKLVDPVWGGVYQYSTNEDWDHPHFEKIMQMQAEDMRIYAMAYSTTKDPRNLTAAIDIARFLTTFLTSSDGALYTSMDADAIPGQHAGEYFALSDADRRARGVPRIDTNIYARENGWAITGLVSLYAASSNSEFLKQAQRAESWITTHRAIANLPPGQLGFTHGDADPAGPYLGDTLAMGRAYLSLYQATGQRTYLQKAAACAEFIHAKFARGEAGFSSAATPDGSDFLATPQREENLALARWANLLSYYTGRTSDKRIALRAARYLTTPEITRKFGSTVGGLLLLDKELNSDPMHLTIVGDPASPKAAPLLLAALALPASYKQLDVIDPTLGPLMHTDDIEFPNYPEPAAFFCADGRCSSPMFSAAALTRQFERTRAR